MTGFLERIQVHVGEFGPPIEGNAEKSEASGRIRHSRMWTQWRTTGVANSAAETSSGDRVRIFHVGRRPGVVRQRQGRAAHHRAVPEGIPAQAADRRANDRCAGGGHSGSGTGWARQFLSKIVHRFDAYGEERQRLPLHLPEVDGPGHLAGDVPQPRHLPALGLAGGRTLRWTGHLLDGAVPAAGVALTKSTRGSGVRKCVTEGRDGDAG